MELKYYKQLDGVRGLAALMVLGFHFFNGINSANSFWLFIKKISVFGQTGVSLFFVLSGFLITRILLKSKSKTNYFSNFYIRRALRIFPLYYLFLTLYYYVFPYLLKSAPITNSWYFWTYLQGFAMTFNWDANGPEHFWSLAVEEHFYFFWPLVIYFFEERVIKRVIAILIIVALVVRLVLLMHNKQVFYFTFSRMDELAVGALLALREAKNKWNTNQHKRFLILATFILIPTLLLWFFVNGKADFTVQLIKFISFAFLYYALIGYMITTSANALIYRFFVSKYMQLTGKISYGLYVYHPVCIALTAMYLPIDSLIAKFFISVVFTYSIAYLTYYGFENYFLKLKRYFN